MTWAKAELAQRAVLREFGSPMRYTAGALPPVDTTPGGSGLLGHFETSFSELDPGTGTSFVTDRPNVFVMIADLPADPAEGDKVEIAGTTYRVQVVNLDGEGGALLVLARRTP